MTLTRKEWAEVGGGLRQHKDMDAPATEAEWKKERGIDDPDLFEYLDLRRNDFSRPGGTLAQELERLRGIGRKHELERILKIDVSFDTRRRGEEDSGDS